MKNILTKSEQKVFNLLINRSDLIVDRDTLAQTIWGDLWLQKYSDWRIDRLIYLLRKKIGSKYTIKTLRNSGYLLTTSDIKVSDLKSKTVKGTLPTKSYLEYMNNVKNKRKVIKDLFDSLPLHLKANRILVVNSYSFDNVDALLKKYPKSTVYFSNFDKRALKFHQDRIEELNINNYSTVYDDIRDSIFKNSLFDLVINDFRLNFNTSDSQNIASMNNIYKLLKSEGKAIISVVIDSRKKTNRNSPWKFKAQENLERLCFTADYYLKLFNKTGFSKIVEFDIENGQKWDPKYKRFLLTK